MSIIRQAAFGGDRPLLKGGLHCHTRRSDGAGDPADVIRLHKANGYDFLALTDHRNYNYTNFAPDVDITILPGMEFDNVFWHDTGFRCFHTVCIGPSREDGNGFEQDERPTSGHARDQFEYQAYLDDIHRKKNLTVLCHPQWSGTPARYFDKLQGNFAMEVWNTGSALGSDMDNDAAYWDELLGEGVKIYGVAADDGHAMGHHCKGWVMVNAENNIPAILDALANGRFYSSTGPVIRDFYVEDDKIVVECDKADRVRLQSDAHPSRIVRGGADGLTRAEFSMDTSWMGPFAYVRATVVGMDGRLAWTNPIWLEH